MNKKNQNNLKNIKSFLKRTNNIQNRIRQLHTEINEIQNELQQFQQTIANLENQTLNQLNLTQGPEASHKSPSSDQSTSSQTAETESDAPDGEESVTSSFNNSDQGNLTDNAQQSPEEPGTPSPENQEQQKQDQLFDESKTATQTSAKESAMPPSMTETTDTEEPAPGEGDYSLSPSEVESGETPSEESRSYQKRMIQKDPRLKTLPNDVLEALARFEELFVEVDRGIQFLDALSVKSRSNQIAIWAGTARKYQDIIEEWEADIPDEFLRKINVFFGKLTTVTREHDCEWIDALKRSYDTDWEQYIQEEKSNLKQSLEREKRVREFLKEPPKEQKNDRKIIRRRLRELAQNPDSSVEEVKSVLSEGMDLLVLDEPALVELAEQHFDELEDPKFSPLKEVVKKQTDVAKDEGEEGGEQEVIPRPTLGPTVKDEILQITQKKRALAYGEEVSKVWKNRIRDAFKLRSLDWFDPDEHSSDPLNALKENTSITNMDYVFLMKSRIENNFSKIKQACKEMSPETIVIEGGAGIAPIREAIQENLNSDD